MNPNDIMVLLAVYVSGSPADTLANYHSPAVQESLSDWEFEGIIRQLTNNSYELTQKGMCLLNAILSLPMPVQTWSMPK